MWADNTALIGTLTVYKTDSTSSENMTILWSRSGRQNQNKIRIKNIMKTLSYQLNR